MAHVIAPRGLRILGALGIVSFALIGVIVVAHPGVDRSLKGRMIAATAVSITIWLLRNLALEPRIVLDEGIVAVHYPGFVRRFTAASITDVRVEHGSLVIRTVDGRTAKPPTLRASVLGALGGNRGARSARGQILDYVHNAHEGADGLAPRQRIAVRLNLWVLVIPLAVLWGEAFLLVRL